MEAIILGSIYMKVVDYAVLNIWCTNNIQSSEYYEIARISSEA